MQPALITLKSAHGRYLTADTAGIVRADAEVAREWEHWTVVPVDATHVALQSFHGTYLTAARDDYVLTPQAKAVEIGPWEVWEVVQSEGVAFRGEHNAYLTAEPDYSVNCASIDAYTWQGWQSDPLDWWIDPVPPVTNRNLLTGELRCDQRVISDANGHRVLVFCHFMEAFSAWCHGKQSEVEAQCQIIAEHYAGIRNLDVLGYWDQSRPNQRAHVAPAQPRYYMPVPTQQGSGWVAWAGREVTPIPFLAYSGRLIPPTPDYWGKKREFVTMLYDLKLKILDDRGDMNAWATSDKYAHMRANGDFYHRLGFGREVLGGLFAINEAWQNGGDDNDLLARMIAAFKEGAGWVPAVCGLSAPGGFSDPDELAAATPPMQYWEGEMPASFFHWSLTPATAMTVHGNRGDHSHIIEHYFGYGYDGEMRKYGKPAFNTEPVGSGQGVSVGRVDDPELLCALSAAAMLGGQPWTFMSGNGVFWNGPIQDMPGFTEVARLSTWMPQDIATWPTVVHSGTRWRGTRILAAVDPTRFDQAISSDGRFVAVCHTVENQGRGGNPLPCERACREFRVINMVSGLVEREGPLGVGQTYQHPGVARLVIGQLE